MFLKTSYQTEPSNKEELVAKAVYDPSLNFATIKTYIRHYYRKNQKFNTKVP